MVGNNRWSNPAGAPHDPSKRMGFQDVDKEVVATRGVKIKNRSAEKRESEKREKEEYKKKFSKNADNTIAHHNDNSSKAVDIISRFMNISQDKTLIINKGGIADDVEREARQDLIQLALDLNNDEYEEDNGKGSVVILSLLSKIVLTYRDRINDLEYELLQVKRAQNSINQSSQSSGGPSNAAK